MKGFAALFQQLDATTSQSAKLAALVAYLRSADAADGAWAVYFLAGGKPRQMVPTRQLKALAQAAAGLPEWLFEESYQAVGDLAETLALLLPPPTAPDPDLPLAAWMQRLLPLRALPPDAQAEALRAQWAALVPGQRFVYFKLITGNFRVGVSRLQVVQALAQVSGVDAKRIAHRLMGYTQVGRQPAAHDYAALVATEADTLPGMEASSPELASQPYPFFLAHPLAAPVDALAAQLGPPGDWQVEWKWDGIRAQVVRRAGGVWIWSRGEELVTDRFPELAAAAQALPDGTVLDGEILVWPGGSALPRPFADLQKRLGRKTLSAALLRDLPVALVAYDLLEHAGQDLRGQPQHVRRALLEALLPPPEAIAAAPEGTLRLSPLLHGPDWQDLARQREAARSLGTEGFMLKHRTAAYGVGRTKDVGVWWKWKIDPMSVDAVLLYAQRGHGRRASLYTDYTFAVWSGPPQDPARQLVPFAKAYSGLTDAEIAQVDAIIRKTTRETFGPVRSVEATLVFELGFEGIARSPRHKSGIAVRFPRMLRWRQDKPVAEADTLQTLAALLPPEASA
ncbi:ATP-dependent DNA ligase [Acidovorax lacteus]|uniref:DNA ligase (ATP) n=1 Tax=Acidovorax lacteus TaxID=1924988 RepID=A0ABP8LK84_9BURK